MPFDKDTDLILESWKKTFPNKVNHNVPSTLKDVKDSTPATSGYGLDVKGQLSDKGKAGNTQVDVSEEDAEGKVSDLLSRLSEFISEPNLGSPNRREYEDVMSELESFVSSGKLSDQQNDLLSRLSEFISEPNLGSPNRREYEDVMSELESLVSSRSSDEWVPFKVSEEDAEGKVSGKLSDQQKYNIITKIESEYKDVDEDDWYEVTRILNDRAIRI